MWKISVAFAAAFAWVACALSTPPLEARSPHPVEDWPGAPVDTPQVLSVCVLRDRNVELVRATLDTTTGDTLVDGVRPSHVYPVMVPPFADESQWFAERTPLPFGGRRYYMFGLPTVYFPHEVTRVGSYRGIPLFARREESELPGALLLPVQPGCRFQPYNYAYP